jgi:hypothetical protein
VIFDNTKIKELFLLPEEYLVGNLYHYLPAVIELTTCPSGSWISVELMLVDILYKDSTKYLWFYEFQSNSFIEYSEVFSKRNIFEYVP